MIGIVRQILALRKVTTSLRLKKVLVSLARLLLKGVAEILELRKTLDALRLKKTLSQLNKLMSLDIDERSS